MEKPKTGAIWNDRAHQHTRGEEVDISLPQPHAVRDEVAAVRRAPHPVAAPAEGAIWAGNAHQDTNAKSRRERSVDTANERRAPMPVALSSEPGL